MPRFRNKITDLSEVMSWDQRNVFSEDSFELIDEETVEEANARVRAEALINKTEVEGLTVDEHGNTLDAEGNVIAHYGDADDNTTGEPSAADGSDGDEDPGPTAEELAPKPAAKPKAKSTKKGKA